MALFPQSFIEEVRLAADIVQIVQDTVPLRRAGATYKGLCPFHGEKTPSFHVNREKGFFHCFGCGVGGDVFKFVELRDRVGFTEAVRSVAERVGLRVPDTRDSARDPAAEAQRESLLTMHEVAAGWFREQLAAVSGARARQQLEARGLTRATVDALGLGFAPMYREGLKSRLIKQGFPLDLVVASGLVVRRENGEVVDRFRNRLMIPICRESGPVAAFGGRAMEADQAPKYLNSPETPVYSKSRTLYGLHLSKGAIRRGGQAVVVEGYFDFAQLWQGGIEPVVATCGTALTVAQAQMLRRFAAKTVLSFDPDSAGQGAAVRSCDLLVGEGFQVHVAVLPAGDDPDSFVRKRGADAYRGEIERSRPYLDFLLDRVAAEYDFASADHRREFVTRMLGVAARIPEATARDQFADRLAHKARIDEGVVRAEIRRAAVARKTTVAPRALPASDEWKLAERQLVAALFSRPAEAFRAIADLSDEDLEGLASAEVLRVARGLPPSDDRAVPGLLLERLNDRLAAVVTRLATGAEAAATPAECVRTLRVLRYERERARVQREIDRLQETGGGHGQIDALLARKGELLTRIDALSS
jgi:DNA primase